MINPFSNAQGIQAKKAILRGLSKQIKPFAKMAGVKVNDALLEAYKDGRDIEFHTFNDWKKKGYSVKPGSKAWVIWSRPKTMKTVIKDEKGQEQENEWEAFSLAFLFDSDQVVKHGSN